MQLAPQQTTFAPFPSECFWHLKASSHFPGRASRYGLLINWRSDSNGYGSFQIFSTYARSSPTKKIPLWGELKQPVL